MGTAIREKQMEAVIWAKLKGDSYLRKRKGRQLLEGKERDAVIGGEKKKEG